MAADGRIIIDTLVHTDKAERSLTALRSKAKSTAQEIAATGKKLDALKGNTKLKEELEAANAAVKQTSESLADVNSRLEDARAKESELKTEAEAAKDTLAKLQEPLKQTESSIQSVSRRLEAVSQNTKLKDRLEDAREKAQQTEEQLDKVCAQFDKLKLQEYNSAKSKFPTFSSSTLSQMAENEVRRKNPELAAKKDRLNARRIEQGSKVKSAERDYSAQQQKAAMLRSQLEQLTARQQEQKAAVDAARASMTAANQAYDKQHALTSSLASQSQRLTTQVEKQNSAANQAAKAYDQQQAEIQQLTRQHEELTARLQQEQAAEDKAGARFRAGMWLKTFGGTLTGAAKQGAAGFGKLAASSLPFSRGMQSCEKSARRFNSRLRGIVSSALIFNVLSKALRTLTGTFSAALTKSAAFNQSMANLKGASSTAAAPLMQLLTPALTALANAAATAMGYVAQMVSFFTGKSIANMQATAKALTGVAGAGSEAATSLAGFDELNVLSKDAGGAGSAGTAPNFGFTPGESPFWQSVMQAVKGGDWAGAGQLFADKMNALVDGWDGAAFGAKLGRTLQHGVDFAFALVTGTDWSAAGAKLGQALSSFMPQLDGKKIGALLVSATTIGLSMLYGFLTNTDPVELARLFSDLVIGALDAMAQALGQYDWGELAGRVLEFLINLDWEGILKSLGDVIAAAWPVILAMIVGIAFAALNPLVLAGLAALAVLILKFLSSMSSDVKEGLVQGFKNGINAVIDLVNKFVGWLNRTLRFTWEPFKLGRTEVFPGGSMQLANLPTVPYLAQGAVIPPNREFLAVLGDQKQGTNIEAPEATLRKIMAEVLAEYGSAMDRRDVTVNLTAALDGEVIYRNQQKIKAGKGYPAGLNPAFG